MLRAKWIWLGLWLVTVCLPSVVAGAPSEQERKRKSLLDRLGIPQQPQPSQPTEPDDDAPAEPDIEDTDQSSAPSEPPAADGQPESPAPAPRPSVTYTGQINKLLAKSCASCHQAGASAGGTRFVLSGAIRSDYQIAKKFVNRARPQASALLTKAAGQQHAGGAVFPSGHANYKRLSTWLGEGAPYGGASRSEPAAAPSAPSTPPGAASPPTSKPAPQGVRKAPRNGALERPSGPPMAIAGGEPGAATPNAASPSASTALAYAPAVHELLRSRCSACHEQGKPAAQGFVITGDVVADYANTKRLVAPGNPEASLLMTKALGQAHGGGPVIEANSDAQKTIADWIEGGAIGPTAPAASSEPADAAAPPQVDARTGASPAAPGRLGDGTPLPQAQHPNRLPFAMPFHLRINGKLDFSYERRNYKNHPFGSGNNAFQTYHHFLFLSRSGAKDPFGFNVELATQQFFEFNARVPVPKAPVGFLFKAGKILVPFGSEPLFHSSYGGRAGFDQQILPVIWSQPGLAVNMQIQAGPVSISNDLYTVLGYALPAADAVINLQNDFSPFEDAKVAVGDRVGVSWKPLTAWYSFQFNPLGFGRLLYMQALDIEFWRLHGVPFVEDIVVGIGGMRADVSRGQVSGPGNDYYHFGSYAMLRYYPIEALYIQYRAGLFTHDNRRGLYFDDHRLSDRDRSSHNVTIGGRYKGFYAALQLFWNLEKANEQDDDFLRVTVGYEF